MELQLVDEWERTEAAKVAKYVQYIQIPSLHRSNQSPRITHLTDSPPSTGMVTMKKPHGLAKARDNGPITNTVIEEFTYGKGTDEEESDEEPEDDLEYPGGAADCLVCPILCQSSPATDRNILFYVG